MERVFRQLAARLAVALVAGALTFAAVVGLFWRSDQAKTDEITGLREQVTVNDSEAQCRSRIASAAMAVERQANSLLREGLADRFLAGVTEGFAERAERMKQLDRREADLTDLQTRSVEVCHRDPAFQPPS